MVPSYLKRRINRDIHPLTSLKKRRFIQPKYHPATHCRHLSSSRYFYALLILRQYIRLMSDHFFSEEKKAIGVDLFMLTPSVSSPMGPGSNSEAIRIKFGKLETFLVDSSQFGFEPLLLNNFNKVYCYLPSMRGERPDHRHLNQFFHCEMEMVGELDDVISMGEEYVQALCEVLLELDDVIHRISDDYHQTEKYLQQILDSKGFPEIDYDDAVQMLEKNGKKKLVYYTKHGRDISSDGELELMKILHATTPIWLKHFDRDRVPFYQKPHPKNKNKTLNADLLFPPLRDGAFGGEILGAGQRQDSPEEIYESLQRQNNISSDPYGWYIDLRRRPKYKTTSGFGLGIERLIAWALAKDNIRDVVPYPRLKDVETYP